jgi:uncharacterized membrane protein YphA (DoxX/SURF4 family)
MATTTVQNRTSDSAVDSESTVARRDKAEAAAAPRWSLATRVAFRFCFVYFVLFSLSNQIFAGLLMIPNVDIPDPGTLWPMRQITFWTARHIFRVTHDLVYTGSGSGDKTFDWVQTFCLLVIALIAATVWSLADRRRKSYPGLYRWFRLVIRFVLASEMFLYGFDKIIPLQMPFPYLTRLLEPYGKFAPMSVLWFSIGASRSYEIFAGSAETVGGILLLVPRTTTLGALICLADMIQVFMLNMTYDVPVKLFSFHLILLSIFLLAPDMRRLCSFFFTERPTESIKEPRLFRTNRANRISVVVQLVFGVYLIGMNIYSGIDSWHQYGGGRPKSTLYGIWEVKQMSIDGSARPALLDDKERWRRVVFDFVDGVSIEGMDENFTGYKCAIDEKAQSVSLTKRTDDKWKAQFAFQRPAKDELVFDGAMDNHKIHADLKLFDLSQFTLVNRGFHWINEYPFQR